jgi:hypothetical protein
MSECMFSRFIADAINHLREKFPVTTKKMTDEQLRIHINVGVNKAAGYNISKQEDVLAFIDYMLFLGNNFDSDDTNPWAKNIFNIRNLDGSEKIARLINTNPIYPEVDNG